MKKGLTLFLVLSFLLVIYAEQVIAPGCTVCGANYACGSSDGVCPQTECGATCVGGDPDCPAESVCDDNVDNDFDGNTDCADSDCAGLWDGSDLCCQSASDCSSIDDGNACTSLACNSNVCSNDNNAAACSLTCSADDCSGATYNDYPATCSGTCSLGSCGSCDCSASSGTCNSASACGGATCGGSSITCHYDGGWGWDSPASVSGTSESCGDGEDNDCDGDTDCADSECASGTLWNACDSTYPNGCTRGTGVYNSCHLNSNLACGSEAACDDGADNDCDGYTDEQDADCGITLDVTPNPSACSQTLTATVTPGDLVLSGTHYIREGSCGASNLCSVTNADRDCTFTSPSTWGSRTYYACSSENSASDAVQVGRTENLYCSNNIDDNCDGLIDEENSIACPYSVSLSPDPVSCDTTTTATVTANDGSLYGTIYLREGSCGASDLGSVSTSGGIAAITPSQTSGLKTIYGCNDGTMNYTDSVVVGLAEAGNCGDGLDNDCDNYVDEEDANCPISVDVTPEPVLQNGALTAQVTAGDSSLSQTVSIKLSSCATSTLCTVSSHAGTCPFTALGSPGSYTYYACIGQNSPTDVVQVGEPEICNTPAVDEDFNSLFDEADPGCPITLEVTPNPGNYENTFTATLTTDGSMAYRVDVKEGTVCSGPTLCSINAGSSTCTFGSIPYCFLSTKEYIGCVWSGSYTNSDQSTTVSFNPPGETCADGIENDCDGYIDEADSTCASGVTLTFSPNPAVQSVTVSPTVTAVDGNFNVGSAVFNFCNNLGCTATGTCTGSPVGNPATCANIAIDGLSSYSGCTFTAPVSDGGYLYHACIGSTEVGSSLTVSTPPEDCGNNFDDDNDGDTDEEDNECGVALSMSPNPISPEQTLTATVTAAKDASLYGTANIKRDSCATSTLCSVSTHGGSCTLTAPDVPVETQFTYYACIGSNYTGEVVTVGMPEVCDNGIDDDGDDFVDEADDDCGEGVLPGRVNINLDPNPTPRFSTITVDVSASDGTFSVGSEVLNVCNHLGCDAAGSCMGSVVGNPATCANIAIDGLSSYTGCTFTAPPTDNDYGYHACIGKTDVGATLSVVTPAEDCNNNFDDDVDTFFDEADATCSLGFDLSTYTPLPSETIVALLTNPVVDNPIFTNSVTASILVGSNVGPPASVDCTNFNPEVKTTCMFIAPVNGAETYYLVVGEKETSRSILVREHCNNGIDDDFDLKIDHADEDCPVELKLYPNPTSIRGPVWARVRPKTGHALIRSNKIMYVKDGPCDSVASTILCQISHLAFDGSSMAACNFTAPLTPGQYKYHACIGENTNDDDENLTVEIVPEACNNMTDDDYDGFFDEADAECNMTMIFSPTPVDVGRNFSLRVSADNGTFFTNGMLMDSYVGSSCSIPIAGNCSSLFVDGSKNVYCTVTAPLIPGLQNYTACIGENTVANAITVNLPGAETDVINGCDDNFDNDLDGVMDEADLDCTIVLTFNPAEAGPGMNTTAIVSGTGFVQTGGLTINITKGALGGPLICTITNPEVDNFCTFLAPMSEEDHLYYAAVGTNNNNAVLEINSSCASCAGTLSGYVGDEFGNDMTFVMVKTNYPPGHPHNADDDFTYTISDGTYSFAAYVGTYTASFSKDYYYTEAQVVQINYTETTILNMVLRKGDCNANCFDWENRCNMDCDGRSFTNTSGGIEYCSFASFETSELCHEKEVNSWSIFNKSGNNVNYVACCEGSPFEVNQPLALVDGEVPELYKRERILTHEKTKRPVKLVVQVWDNAK